jgi:hypothetical protein
MRLCLLSAAASAVLIGLTAFSRPAEAETITYIETATATGSLAGQSFTDALVTLTATGDTSNVTSDGFQSAEMSIPLELSIAGVGSTGFTDSIIVVFNGHTGSSEAYGFGDTDNGYAVLFTQVPYSGTFYDLQSAIGPINGEAAYNPGVSFNTAAGAFEMTTAADATFQAVTPAATPEPGSLMLLGTGVLGFAGVMRRRLL